jgi:hypothetical protein
VRNPYVPGERSSTEKRKSPGGELAPEAELRGSGSGETFLEPEIVTTLILDLGFVPKAFFERRAFVVKIPMLRVDRTPGLDLRVKRFDLRVGLTTVRREGMNEPATVLDRHDRRDMIEEINATLGTNILEEVPREGGDCGDDQSGGSGGVINFVFHDGGRIPFFRIRSTLFRNFFVRKE